MSSPDWPAARPWKICAFWMAIICWPSTAPSISLPQQIHCSQCMEKHHRNGEVTYHHQLLGAALVCPGHKEVIPLMPEPILKQDGETKNDCERNALKRFLPKFRQDHPHLRVIATLDALYANAPVIRDLRNALIPWIIRVKPEGNAFLFKQVRQLAEQGLTEEFDSDRFGRRVSPLPAGVERAAERVESRRARGLPRRVGTRFSRPGAV